MHTAPVQNCGLGLLPTLPASFVQPNWFAAQTRVNQEKQVAGRMQETGIECFLPLYQEVHRRTDRNVVLQMPLFPGYVFVRIALRDRLKVLMVPRVVRLVSFGAMPATIPQQDIEVLRAGLAHGTAMPHPYLKVGRRVRVVGGPFEGIEGVLLRRKTALRVVVSIEAILRSFTVEVDETEVEPIGETRRCSSASQWSMTA